MFLCFSEHLDLNKYNTAAGKNIKIMELSSKRKQIRKSQGSSLIWLNKVNYTDILQQRRGLETTRAETTILHLRWIIEVHVEACLDCRLSPPFLAYGSASQSHWWPLPLPPGSDLCLTLHGKKKANADALRQCMHTGWRKKKSPSIRWVFSFMRLTIWQRSSIKQGFKKWRTLMPV